MPLSERVCKDAQGVAAPLRRLTRSEYQTTVANVFGETVPEAEEFLSDEETAGFSANWVSAPSVEHVVDYEKAAQAVAERTLARDPNLLRSCSAGTTENVCIPHWIQRAFRRSPDAEETESLLAFHRTASAEFGSADADRMLIELLLQTPQFLYVTPPYAGTELTSLASRLAYFLTAAPPDDQLLAQAEGGTLLQAGTLEAEVDRLLGSEKASHALFSFAAQWLDLDRAEAAEKDASAFPEFDESLRADMVFDTTRFLMDAFARGGSLTELMTSTRAWVSPALAELYGVGDLHPGSGVIQLDLPESERAGILTQASFLAGHAHQTEPSWVLRGDFVRRHLLCDELPPPPAGVDLSIPNDGGRLENPVCRACHELMDPIGQSFDRYDAIGRYHELSQTGASIVESGSIAEGALATDTAGPFENPRQLARTLAESESVRACIGRKVFRFASRRLETEDESCAIGRTVAETGSSGPSLKQLFRRVALSREFLGTERP